MDHGFFNEDCMTGMARYPDKYFDLAIVDPPYGIGIGHKRKADKSISIVGGGKAIRR